VHLVCVCVCVCACVCVCVYFIIFQTASSVDECGALHTHRPRYKLLLTELLKDTPETHPDRATLITVRPPVARVLACSC